MIIKQQKMRIKVCNSFIPVAIPSTSSYIHRMKHSSTSIYILLNTENRTERSTNDLVDTKTSLDRV